MPAERPPAKKPRQKRMTCTECKHEFMYLPQPNKEPPEICGLLTCRAARWTDEEWMGRARMARARQKSGGDLNDLDRRALAKYRNQNVQNIQNGLDHLSDLPPTKRRTPPAARRT